MKTVFFWIVFLGFSALGKAQEAPLGALDSIPESRIEYFDSNYVKVSKDSAWGFYEIKGGDGAVTRTGYTMDSVLLSVVEFSNYSEKIKNGHARHYYYNGNLKSVAFYLDGNLEGNKKKYYENGQLKMAAYFANGELDGDVNCYHPNGKLSREESFINGVSRGGKCYGADGSDTVCGPFNQTARYPKGDEAFSIWVQEEFIYPAKMRKAKKGGRVLVRFAVDEQGWVTKIKVVESTDVLMDEEAIRVLSKAPRWNPGYFEGEPVTSWRQIPIQLNME